MAIPLPKYLSKVQNRQFILHYTVRYQKQTKGVVDKVQGTRKARGRSVPVSPPAQQCWAQREANSKLRDVTFLSIEITNTFGKQGWSKNLRFNLTTNLTTWSLYFRKTICSSNPVKPKFSTGHDPQLLNTFTTYTDVDSLKIGLECFFSKFFITFSVYLRVWSSEIK